jgi:hypothetical protein
MAIDDPLRERIEAVLRTLPLRQDLSATELESRIAVAAGELTRRAKITLSFLPDPGAPALDKQATKALHKLACSLDTAIHTLAFLLPEPAAVALVDAGLVPEKAQQALEAMLKSIDGAYLSFKPKKPGRPPAHLSREHRRRLRKLERQARPVFSNPLAPNFDVTEKHMIDAKTRVPAPCDVQATAQAHENEAWGVSAC